MSSSHAFTILITGYAKAPQGTAMYEKYRHAGVVLEVDPETGTVVDADFTAVTELARDFFKRVVSGHRLGDGFDALLSELRERYMAPSDNAAITALKAANKRYIEKVMRHEDPRALQ